MHAMPVEKEHILSVDEGIRHVESFFDFQSEQEVDSFLDKCKLIGVGCNAIVFRIPHQDGSMSEMLIRIELFNAGGYEWTLDLLRKLKSIYPYFASKIEYLESKVYELGRGKKSFKRRLKNKIHDQKKRIAAHNSVFRHDPKLTMPINSYYTFQGRLFALRIKFLDGQSLSCVDPTAQLTPELVEILDDKNTANLLVAITNSAFTSALIDITTFRPSNEWPSVSL